MTTITDSDAALAGTLAMLRTALAVAGLRDDRGTAARLATLIADHTDPTPDVCVNLRCDGIRGAAAYLTSCGETPAGWRFTADDEQDHSAPADRADLDAHTEPGRLTDSVAGIFGSDWTGGKSTVDFVREQRDTDRGA